MPISRPAFARRAALIVPVILLAALAGCTTQKPVPPCPPIRVDSSTASLTKFKDGPGRDVTDIEYQAEIVGYKGKCVHEDDNVEVQFDLDLTIAGGAAAKGGAVDLYYFVAIPQFFPDPAGKHIIQVKRDVPASGKQEHFTESNVRLRIPLTKDQAGAAFDIYVGFQVDNAQLEYNRANPR